MFTAPARFQLVPNPHQVSESADFLTWGSARAHDNPFLQPKRMVNNFVNEEQTAGDINFSMMSRLDAKENSSLFGNMPQSTVQCYDDRKSVPEYRNPFDIDKPARASCFSQLSAGECLTTTSTAANSRLSRESGMTESALHSSNSTINSNVSFMTANSALQKLMKANSH